MVIPFHAETPPLRQEATGAIRVGNTRVLLELVLEAFQEEVTPQEIVRRYPTLALQDVYATIGYCLRHPAEIEAYLREREAQAGDMDAKIEGQQRDLSQIRERLRERRAGAN